MKYYCDMCHREVPAGQEAEEMISWGRDANGDSDAPTVCRECDEKHDAGLIWDKGTYTPLHVVQAREEEELWERQLSSPEYQAEIAAAEREAEEDEASNAAFWADEIWQEDSSLVNGEQ